MKVSDYMVLQGIAYATDIGGRGSLPYRPLVSLPSVGEQFDKFFGVNAQADARARDLVGGNAEPCSSQGAGNGRTVAMPEISTGHPTHPQRKDAQPSRAASPNPATFNPDPPTPDEVAEAYQHKYGELTC